MAVDAISQVSRVSGASDGESVRDTLSVLVAVVNEDVHRCGHARNLEVHAPSTTGIRAPGANLISVVPADRDLEGVTSWVAVDAVSKVSCIIRTDHSDGGRDAFLVLV
jgi:hypothetical protein